MRYIILCIICALPLFSQSVEDEKDSNWIFSPGYSFGVVRGESFTNYPQTSSVYFNPPLGYDIGSYYFDISLVYGNFKGNLYEYPRYPRHSPLWTSNEEILRFDAPFVLLGGSLNIIKNLYTEGHIGTIGKGFGFRGFLGRNIQTSVKDHQVKVGTEIFIGLNMNGEGNPSYIITCFCRLEIFLDRIKFGGF